ncbi:tetratricopeptide repeat protein [Chloroflexi bacterium TSY]|nr:tetratricopeptide repeat protein [Chloroflexi bacterium TSY]
MKRFVDQFRQSYGAKLLPVLVILALILPIGGQDVALAQSETEVELPVQSADDHVAQGHAHLRAGEYEAALTRFHQAIEVDSNHVAAYLGRGETYFKMGKLTEALEDLDRAIEITPQNSDAYTLRSQIYLALGRTEEALADLQSVVPRSGMPTEVPTPTPEVTNTPAPSNSSATSNAIQNLLDAPKAVVRIQTAGRKTKFDGTTVEGSGGSGFLIDPSGIAVTNNHVVTGAGILTVYVGAEQQPRNAHVLGVSECSDLAVIQIAGQEFPYLEWYDGPLEELMEVFAVGFPLGAKKHVWKDGRLSTAEANGQTYWASLPKVLEHTAITNPGNSGGPLLDKQGRVIGINYASSRQRDQYYAISRDEARPIIERLRQQESIDTIGIDGTAFVTDEKNEKDRRSGIWVASVEPGSPADNTGIQGGDILLFLQGIPLAVDGTMFGYCNVLRSHHPEKTLTVEVLRLSTGELCKGQPTSVSPPSTPTPTPPLYATVQIGSLNVRRGPGVNYARIGVVSRGQQMPVIGQANSCSWLEIVTEDGQTGWISGAPQYTRLDGICREIPVSTATTPPRSGFQARLPVRFDNHFNKEAYFTLTKAHEVNGWNMKFTVVSRRNQTQYLAPDRYTFSWSVPGGPSGNGEFTLARGGRMPVISIFQNFD